MFQHLHMLQNIFAQSFSDWWIAELTVTALAPGCLVRHFIQHHIVAYMYIFLWSVLVV